MSVKKLAVKTFRVLIKKSMKKMINQYNLGKKFNSTGKKDINICSIIPSKLLMEYIYINPIKVYADDIDTYFITIKDSNGDDMLVSLGKIDNIGVEGTIVQDILKMPVLHNITIALVLGDEETFNKLVNEDTVLKIMKQFKLAKDVALENGHI